MYKRFIERKTLIIAVISAVFILTSIGLGVSGVHIYDTVKLNDSRQELSDASGYFSDIVRKADGNYIRTASIGGSVPALVIESYHNGQSYETWYFTYDDHLKKIRAEKGAPVTLEEGDDIMALAHMDVSLLQDDLLELRLTSTDGTSGTFSIHFYNYEGGSQ